MGLFGNLLGRKPQPAGDSGQEGQFDQEWEQAVRRFGVVVGLGAINMDLKHPKTGKVMTPHEGLGETFGQWKQIEAAYDRRKLLFDLLADMVGRSMNRWQGANYLVATRRPDKALALLEQASADEAAAAAHQAAAARALLSLDRPEDALAHAARAAEAAPDNTRLQVLHADALHLVGQCEEAHTIYAALMPPAGPVADGSPSVAAMFASVFSQETGAVPSPVMALDVVEQMGDPTQSGEFWRLAEVEFYDSPYFRMHQAYHLASDGATERSFAKLLALVQEMPWLREASLNLSLYFAKFDPSGRGMMPEFQAKLRETIQRNGWTTAGMRPTEINTGG